MTDLREAAQAALAALEAGPDVDPIFAGETEDALRAALAEPVQEPMKLWPLAPLTGYYDVGGKRVWLEKDEPFPQPAPPQRKPLTEEEIWALYYALPSDDFERSDRIDFARAVEAAHGIK